MARAPKRTRRDRGRGAETYARRTPALEPYETVLIVCEGSKSEPSYFNRLRAVYRLSNANVRITPADGTDPMSIVLFAEAEFERERYDRVFCVFDRDGHENFDAAVHQIEHSDRGRAGRFKAVTTWPCFEIWILLHFVFTSAPFNAAGNESSCERVIKALKQHFPNYAKGLKNIFDDLIPNLQRAIKHAQQLSRQNQKDGSVNPSTKVHDLVEYLVSLKDVKQ
jgi:hypothetical protein